MDYKIIYNKKLLCQTKKYFVFYKKGQLILQNSKGEKKYIVHPFSSVYKRILSQLRIAERLFRLEPRFGYPYNETMVLVSWDGYLFVIDVEKGEIINSFKYRKGMHNPLSIAKINACFGLDCNYIFGDYWSNPQHESVVIYKVEKLSIKPIFEFKAGTILHVHGCVPDDMHERILILTGDNDNESGIWEAKDNFKDVKPLLIGSQQYRTCAAFPVESGILYATDTPLERNYIYHYIEQTKNLVEIYELAGPCIYSTTITNQHGETFYIFATSVEPDSSLPAWKYKMTYKLGNGVKDRYTHIYGGNLKRGFKEIAILKKDLLPIVLFQFGNVQFPTIENNAHLWVTPIALKKYDGKTISIEQPEYY